MCVCTFYKIYKVPEPNHVESKISHSYAINSMERDLMAIHTYKNGVNGVSCDSGCGPFRTEWDTNLLKNSSNQNSENAPCSDQASIYVSGRDTDRIIWLEHKELDFYDDFMRIGDKVHERTFSIQVRTMLS